jgi:3-oxoacyl-[acyl-carrier-protein] synthase-3
MPLADKTQPISRLASTQVPSSVFVSRIAAPAKKPTQPRSDIPGIKILGAGASAGSKLVLNEDLAALGYDSDWIVQRTGIKSRYHVAEGEATSDMAIRAAEQCLANAGVDASEVDLIIVATVSPDYLTPSTAWERQRPRSISMQRVLVLFTDWRWRVSRYAQAVFEMR